MNHVAAPLLPKAGHVETEAILPVTKGQISSVWEHDLSVLENMEFVLAVDYTVVLLIQLTEQRKDKKGELLSGPNLTWI